MNEGKESGDQNYVKKWGIEKITLGFSSHSRGGRGG